MAYKITLKTKIEVTDFLTDDKILDQTFVSSITYRAQNNYSDTFALENTSIEDLLNKTYQELVIRLSQNIITK